MAFWGLILAVILCCCVYFYNNIKKKLSYFKDLGIPHLPPKFIFGNMKDMIFLKKHTSDLVQDAYNINREAKYVGFYALTKPVIIITDMELIKEVAIKNFDHFPDHRLTETESKVSVRSHLFGLTGKTWHDSRQVVSPSFTSSKLKTISKIIFEFTDKLMDHLSEISKDPANEIDMKDTFTKCSNDIMAKSIFGIEVDSLGDPNNSFFQFGKMSCKLSGSMTLKMYINKVFPRLSNLLKIQSFSESALQYFNDIVRNEVKDREDNNVSKSDFLQLIMDARCANSNISLDYSEIAGLAFSLYFGGFDSTPSMMSWVVYDLTVNPEAQRKLQHEIDEVLRRTEGKIRYDDINSIEYLDAVLAETMRMYPIPFTDRICKKSYELPPALPGLDPYVVQPGSPIWIPVFGIQHDPNLFENPKEYNPDRHMGIKNCAINSLTFGIGPRTCVAKRFVMFEMKIVLFCLLAKFNLKISPKTPIPLVFDKKNYALAPDGGIWLKMERRKSTDINISYVE